MKTELEWFRPSERLPEDGYDVLFFRRDSFGRVHFYGGGYFDLNRFCTDRGYYGDVYSPDEVVCWADTPECPTGER